MSWSRRYAPPVPSQSQIMGPKPPSGPNFYDFFLDPDTLISALSYHMPTVMMDPDIRKYFNQRYSTSFSKEDVDVAAKFVNYVEATRNEDLYRALANFCAKHHLDHLVCHRSFLSCLPILSISVNTFEGWPKRFLGLPTFHLLPMCNSYSVSPIPWYKAGVCKPA